MKQLTLSLASILCVSHVVVESTKNNHYRILFNKYRNGFYANDIHVSFNVNGWNVRMDKDQFVDFQLNDGLVSAIVNEFRNNDAVRENIEVWRRNAINYRVGSNRIAREVDQLYALEV